MFSLLVELTYSIPGLEQLSRESGATGLSCCFFTVDSSGGLGGRRIKPLGGKDGGASPFLQAGAGGMNGFRGAARGAAEVPFFSSVSYSVGG